MFGRLLCSLGLHRCVTTREGSSRKGVAASHIHVHCYRRGCDFFCIVDTSSGRKDYPTNGGATTPSSPVRRVS